MYLNLFICAIVVFLLNAVVLLYIGEYRGVRDSISHKVQIIGLFILVFWGMSAVFSKGFYYSDILFFVGVLAMFCLALIDYQTMILPDTLNGLLLVVILVGRLLELDRFALVSWKSALIGMGIGFGLFLLIAVVTRGAMGGGDIKLMAILGLWFGALDIWIVTVMSFVLGAVLSVGLLILKIKGRKDAIPFGPFIILAALLVLLYRDIIVGLYFSIL
jgi:leader peptidase (prepilin peptidase)/N-methyltransferase